MPAAVPAALASAVPPGLQGWVEGLVDAKVEQAIRLHSREDQLAGWMAQTCHQGAAASALTAAAVQRADEARHRLEEQVHSLAEAQARLLAVVEGLAGDAERQYATSSLARDEALANVRQLVGTVDEIQRCVEREGGGRSSTMAQLREQEATLAELRRSQGDEAAKRRTGLAELQRLQREASARQQRQGEELAEVAAEASGARREVRDVALSLQRLERQLSAVGSELAAELSDEVRAAAAERMSEGSAERQRLDTLQREASSSAAKRTELAVQLERMRVEVSAAAATQTALEGSYKESHLALSRRIDGLQVGALKERIGALEASHRKLECVHGHSTGQRIEWERHHAALDRRVQQLESAAGGAADGLAASRAQLQDLQGRLDAEAGPRERRHSQFDERLARLEALLGETCEVRARESEAERSARVRQHSELEERLRHLESRLGETHDRHALQIHEQMEGERGAREKHHAAVEERMQSLTELLSDATGRLRDLEGSHSELRERHERAVRQSGAHEEHRSALEERLRELEGLRRGHEELQRRVGAERSARDDHHASVLERLTRFEASAGEVAARQAAALEATCQRMQDAQKLKHSLLEERIQVLEKVVSASVASAQRLVLEDSERPQIRLQSVEERLKHLEKLVGRSSDKVDGHVKDPEAAERMVQDARRQLEEEAQARDRRHIVAEQGLLARLQAIVEETVSRRTRELQAACERSLSSSLRSDAQRESCEEQHAVMERRVEHIEKLVRDSAVVLDAAYQKLQEFHCRTRPEKGAECDAQDDQQGDSSDATEAPEVRQMEGRLRRLQLKMAKAAEERGAAERAAQEGQLLDQFLTLPASQAVRMFMEHRN